MATNIFKFDGTLLTTVADGALDQSHASIKIPGRGYRNYGEPVMENMLWMLENFSGTVEPPFPLTGQLWYDTSSGNGILKVYTGLEWTVAGGVISSPEPPTSQLNPGAFWYDSVNLQLNIYNGTSWDIVGPLGSKINTDPLDPAIPANSVIDAITVISAETTTPQQLWRFTVGGIVLAILSTNPTFTPLSTTLTNNGFAKIYPGINFNSTIPNVGLSGDSTVFKSTQTNLPKDDAVYNLGSANKRINDFYSMRGVFSDKVAINTTPGSYSLQVNGSTYLQKAVTLGPSNGSAPPIKWTTGNLTPQPQNGAVEFDGNNFYFTGLRNGIATRLQPIFEAATVNSRTLYVSTLGDDTNDGRSKTSAYRTIARAVKYLRDNNLSGYSILVESGEYLEQNPIRVPPRISIVGDNLRRVIVRPVHNQLDLFHVDVNTFFFGMTFKDHRSPAFCFAFPASLATAVVNGDPVSPNYQKIVEIIPKYSSWNGVIDSDGYAVGYARTQDAAVYIEGPSFDSNGSSASARANLVNGGIADIIITNGGADYTTAPDQITITGGTPTVQAQVQARVRNGEVVGIDIINPGSGYTYPVTITISGGGGSGATATVLLGKGIIGSYTILNAGSGYNPDRPPWVSITPVDPVTITSSPYVQNCSSITGPFDVNGNLIENIPLPYNNDDLNVAGYGNLDENGAGAGIRIDGQVVSAATVVRSFVADSFTQLNQGGIGHLIINKGYAQFVSCFTTFSSIGYWARGGGFANISNSVIDFGNFGVVAEGYYPVPYLEATMGDSYYSTVGAVTLSSAGTYNTRIDDPTVPDTFPVTFTGGNLIPGSGVAATGYANLENGKVTGITITSDGFGYRDYPEVDFSQGDAWLKNGSITNRASGTVELISNPEIKIVGATTKPQVASAMLLDGKFYTVKSVLAPEERDPPLPAQLGTWYITIIPAIITANQGAQLTFHDVSNISTGGLALEYVGSGVTYNALPRYGGIPRPENQVVDRTTDESVANNYAKANPGVVYYVTIDNVGDFKIGPYFGVNFVDGSVRLNANNFELTNITRIGPFKRFGASVGTYADEISNDPSLTHLSNLNYDNSTIPTQSAVRNYMKQITTNVIPSVDAATSPNYSLGTASKRWNVNAYTLSATTANIGSTSLTSATLQTLTVTGTSTLTGTVTTGGNATIGNNLTVNGTSTLTGLVTTGGNANIGDNLNVSGTLAVGLTTTLTGATTIGSTATVNGLATLTNGLTVNGAGVVSIARPTTISNTLTVTGASSLNNTTVNGSLTVTGAVQTGSMAISGALTVTGDITAFFTSDARLKTNLELIPNALEKVSEVNGYTFDWNDDAKAMNIGDESTDVGVVAQEIEKVMPEVVKTRANGYKAVNYEKLVPLLIEAIKELKEKVERLEKGN